MLDNASRDLVKTIKKTVWKETKRNSYSFICPHCRTHRTLPLSPRPGSAQHIFQIFLCAAFFTCLTWNFFTWKGIVSFLPFWSVFEVMYRLRVRARLACGSCGFDPFLYLSDVSAARQKIEGHWRKRFEEKGIPYPEKPAETDKASLTESSAQS